MGKTASDNTDISSNMTMTSVDDGTELSHDLGEESSHDAVESSHDTAAEESSHDAVESSHDAAAESSSHDAAESSHDAVESSHDSSHDLADDYENCKTDELKNIRGVACSNKDIYNTMCDLLKAVDTDYALASGMFTAFFPTDAAFAAIADVTNTLSDEQMATIVKFHIHEGDSIAYEELECKGLLDMANGKTSRTKCDEGKRYQNGPGNHYLDTFPLIIKNSSDIVTCNGIVHTIDAVMLPKISVPPTSSSSSDTTTVGESASTDTSSTDEIDYMECPLDKHGCYCCATEYEYPGAGGAASCRTDHKGRYCCGAEDQCAEEAVHPTTDTSHSDDASSHSTLSSSTTGASTSEEDNESSSSSADTADTDTASETSGLSPNKVRDQEPW